MLVLPVGIFCTLFTLLDGVPGVSFLGFCLGFSPPYFFNSSWVESNFVAAFSLSIVFVRSACRSSNL